MTKRKVIEDSDDDDEEEERRQPSPGRAVSVFTHARPNHAGGFQSTDSIEAETAGTGMPFAILCIPYVERSESS